MKKTRKMKQNKMKVLKQSEMRIKVLMTKKMKKMERE